MHTGTCIWKKNASNIARSSSTEILILKEGHLEAGRGRGTIVYSALEGLLHQPETTLRRTLLHSFLEDARFTLL